MASIAIYVCLPGRVSYWPSHRNPPGRASPMGDGKVSQPGAKLWRYDVQHDNGCRLSCLV